MSQSAFLTPPQKPFFESPTNRPGSLSGIIRERKKNGTIVFGPRESSTPTPAPCERQHISPLGSGRLLSTPSPLKPPPKTRQFTSPQSDNARTIVKGILTDTMKKIREIDESSMKSQNEKKCKTLVEELFARCKSLFGNLANFTTDGTTVPADVFHFITAYLDLDPIFPTPPGCWAPPAFEKAEEYCFDLCMQCREIAPFGTYDDQSLQISLCRRVTCYGDGDYDLVGEGILKCGANKIVEIVVLGSINDTGTALLLDKEGNVWLYHIPNAADGYFAGMKSQAALVMRKDEVMFPETKLQFHEEYDEARVECYGKLI